MRISLGVVAIVLSIVAVPAASQAGECSSSTAHHQPAQTYPVVHHEAAQADIVDTAVGAKKFKTLVAAVQAAGLVETLKGKGPFTVLAPSDEAFAKLPKGTVESLLKPENKKKLVSILTYHVVPGRVLANDVIKVDGGAKTVQGSKISVSMKDGIVMLDKAKILKTDIEASNGVIHVIDSVLMPH